MVFIANQDRVIRPAEKENMNFIFIDEAESYSSEHQLAPILSWDVDKSSVLEVFWIVFDISSQETQNIYISSWLIAT